MTTAGTAKAAAPDTDGTENHIGIIYPVMKKNIALLETRRNPVYVKYITHPNSKRPTRLKPGDFLFLYVSKGHKTITNHSKIRCVSLKNPTEINRHYRNSIQMDENEFSNYIEGRENRPLLTLELEVVYRFEPERTSPYPMTMAGRYLTHPECVELIEGDS